MDHYVTIRDIAQKTGFSVSTVSRALSQKGRISSRTRSVIEKAALELHYHPDPHLAILSEYRKNQARKTFRGLIAFCIPENFPEANSNRSLHTKLAMQGAQTEAEKLGYQIEEMTWPTHPSMQSQCLKTLYHRGFEGIIFLHEMVGNLNLSPSLYSFAAVNIINVSASTSFPNILSHIGLSVTLAFEKIRKHGYQNTGLITLEFKNKIQNPDFLKTFFFEHAIEPFSKKKPVLEINEKADSLLIFNRVDQWMKKYKFDSFLFQGSEWLSHLLIERNFFKDHKRVGISFDLVDPLSNASGFYNNRENIGQTALREIHSQISLQQFSTTPQAKQILLPQTWKEGKTFPSSL